MADRLAYECARAAERVRSMRIRDLRYSIAGDTVTVEGAALTPEAIDSAIKLFRTTSAREVVNRLVHAPPDQSRPGSLMSPFGYVQIEEMGPHGARLVETLTWEVAAGDTLASIARSVYGDAAAAERILEANQQQLAADGVPREGQRLRLPPR